MTKVEYAVAQTYIKDGVQGECTRHARILLREDGAMEIEMGTDSYTFTSVIPDARLFALDMSRKATAIDIIAGRA